MLKFTHFESLDNLWKQLFLLVPHSAVYLSYDRESKNCHTSKNIYISNLKELHNFWPNIFIIY